MKRVLWILLGIVILVAGGAFVAVSRIDPEILRTKMADMTREATGKPLYMAEVPKISLMPLGVTFGELSWGMEGGKAAAQGISVEAKGGLIRLEFLPLLGGQVVVDEVKLESPRVTVRPEAKEMSPAPAAPAAEAGKTAAKDSVPTVVLSRLNISNGSLLLENEKGESVRVEAFNASIADMKSGNEGSVKLDMGLKLDNPPLHGTMSLAGYVLAQKDSVTLRQTKVSFTPLSGIVPASLGTVQLVLDGHFLKDGMLDLTALKLSLAGLQLEASGKGRVTESQFVGSLRTTAEPGLLGKNLKMDLPAFPGKGKTSLSCNVTLAPDTLSVNDVKGDLDGTSLSGSLALGLGANLSAVRGNLALGALDLDKMQGAKAAPAPATAATPKAPAAASDEIKLARKAIWPKVDLGLSVASLKVKKITLKDISAKVQGAGGASCVYTVSPLQWTFASGGRQSSAITVALPGLDVSVKGTLRELAVGPLLQALSGSSSADAVAAADYDLTMNVASAARVKSSLSGKGSLSAVNIILDNVSILPKGAPVKGGAPTHFTRFQAPFTARNGTITISSMTLVGQGLTAEGGGTVVLPKESVDMSARVATLGLRIPVLVGGTFSNLSYGVDPKWAKEALMGLPGTLVEGGKGAGGAVKGAGQRLGGAGEKVGGAIKGLFGK